MKLLCVVLALGGGLLLSPAQAVAKEGQAALDAAFEALPSYDWGPGRDALGALDAAIVASHGQPQVRATLEARLLQVLQSDATRAAKEYACRKLQQIGSVRSVPALSGLLDNPELAHLARSALEAIPDGSAVDALRAALPRLAGDLQVGIINSLGQRRDANSVESLQALLRSTDLNVVKAVVRALARIETPESAHAVLEFRAQATAELRLVATDACLQVARRWLHSGRLREAAEVYDALKSCQREPVKMAVLQGLLVAEPAQAKTRLLAALADDDDRLRRFAAEWVRDNNEDQLTEALAGAMTELPMAGQVLLLDALRERDHPAVRAAALAALHAQDTSLRTNAIGALGRSGRPTDVAPLAGLTANANPPEREAVVASLARLRGEQVDAAILGLLRTAAPSTQVALLRALAARKSPGAVPLLVEMAQAKDTAVRIEAFRAMQVLADASAAGELVKLLATTLPGAERDMADQAVWRCCLRIPDPARRADPVLAELKTAPPAARAALLPSLGRLGGSEALAVVGAAMNDPDGAIHDAAVRALANWPDATVADQLMQLAREADQQSHRVWALRGFARVIARQGSERPQETFESLRTAMDLAERSEDRQLILSRLTAARVPGSLALALSYLDDAQLQEVAIDATASLAEAMKDSHPQQARAALERVTKVSQNPELHLHIGKLLWNMQQSMKAP